MNAFPSEDANVKIDTDISEKKFAFKWIVQKISKIPKSVLSMRFSLAGDENKNWFATVTTLPEKQFKVSLTCDSKKPIPLRIEHTSMAFDLELKSLGGISSGPLVFEQKLGEQRILLDEVDCPEDDRKLIIECSMKIYGLDLNTTCELFDSYDAPDMDVVEYQNGFRRMMKDELLADLKIYTAGRCFRAHKCVLNVRAPTFFKRHKDAIAQGEMALNTVPSDIFQRLLEYIYTGDEGCLPVRDSYPKLYSLAHKYELAGLKRRCAKAMSEDLSVDSVVDIYLLATESKDELLLMQLRLFMRKNLKELSTVSKWNNLLKCNLNVMEDVMKLHE